MMNYANAERCGRRAWRRSLLAARIVAAALHGAGCLSAATAQTVLEDAKGRSALLVPAGFFLGFNTGDASAQIALYRIINTTPLFFGVSVQAASTGGVAPVFGSGTVRPGATIEPTVGFKSHTAVIAIRYEDTWSELGIIDTSTSSAAQFRKTTHQTWEGAAAIQWLPTARGGGALAIGRRRVNNYEDLSKATVRTNRSSTDSSGKETQLVTSNDGRIGPLHQEDVTFADADLLFVPLRCLPLSIRLFGRFLLERPAHSDQRVSAGLDVGVHKAHGDPIADRRVALVVQFSEHRPGDKGTGIGHQLSLSLVANLAPIVGTLFHDISR